MNYFDTADNSLSFHHRLLSGDPTASSAIIEYFLPRLENFLKIHFSSLKVEETMVWDASVEAVFNYIQHPESFKPELRSLEGYLRMSASGDFLNLYKKEKRRYLRNSNLDAVESFLIAGNSNVEEQVLAEMALRERMQETRIAIERSGLSELDRQFLMLMQTGERNTGEFARVLNILHLPLETQRRIVKQNKDRLKVRLKRRARNQDNLRDESGK